jgi:hypothetical protein
MFCQNCGKENQPDTRFCINCGTALPESLPTVVPAPPKPAKAKGTLLIVGVAAAVLVVLLAVGAVLLFGRFSFSGGGKHLLVGTLERDEQFSLHLVQAGREIDEGVELVKDIEFPRGQVRFVVVDGNDELVQWEQFGGFLPGSNRALYWFDDDERTQIQEIRIGREEPQGVFDARDSWIAGRVWANSNEVIFVETRDSGMRCYVARPGQEADRVAKGDSCGVTRDGRTAYFSEQDGDETTFTVLGTDGKGETVLLDGVELIGEPEISFDGARVAYVEDARGGREVYVVGVRDDSPVLVAEDLSHVAEYGFSPTDSSVLYVVGVNRDGETELWLSTEDSPIAEGGRINAAFDPKGQHLVYAVDEGDEVAIHVHSVKNEDDVEVLTGDDLEFAVAPSFDQVFAIEETDGESILYSIDVQSGDAVEIFSEDDVYPDSVFYVSGGSVLYIYMEMEDDTESLYVAHPGGEDGYYLLEDWYSIELLSLSGDGRKLIFSGWEDSEDDPILYVIDVEEGSDPVELDDDHEDYYNAVFAANNRSILYTGLDNVGGEVEAEILQVRADGEESPERLYKDAFLVSTQWSNLHPWLFLW